MTSARPLPGFGLLAMLFVLPGRAAGQVIDARLIPPGSLRVSFSPDYQSWGHVFDDQGLRQPLGRYFSGINTADLFPSLAPAQLALRAISNNASYQLSVGSVATTVDADVRHFPLDFAVGLARRLTINATIPIVVTRARGTMALDSSSGNSGWNQAAAESGSTTGLAQITGILTQLDRAANDLAAQIAAGSYGCPGSGMCATAQTLVGDLRGFRLNLVALSGVASSSPMPPVAPLASSAEGMALTGKILDLNSRLGAFGVAPVPGTFPLPTARLESKDLATILGGTPFGYQASVPAYSKRARLGDIDVGARLGLIQSPRLRVVLSGSAHLPTGNRDFADNLIDIGTGDRQLDLVGGMEISAEGGPVSLTMGGWYTLQRPGSFVRRITPASQPIAPASTTTNVNRDLGDILSFTASPALQLVDGFRVYGMVSYYHKGEDRHTDIGAPAGGVSAAVLDSLTAMRSLTVGGGLTYRLSGGRNDLPMDAGMSYARTISGSGGFTPAATTVSMYLRAYYKLW